MQAIEKDNNFIYLDVVPKTSNLEPIVGFQVAKAKPFNDEERLSAKFTGDYSSFYSTVLRKSKNGEL